jgi:hypothetical protein
LYGEEGIQEVVKVCQYLTNGSMTNNATVNDSCGMHLHIDGRDLKWDDVRRVMRLWIRAQDWIFCSLPAYRKTNQYCKPLDITLEQLDDCSNEVDLASLIYGLTGNSIEREWTIANLKREK